MSEHSVLFIGADSPAAGKLEKAAREGFEDVLEWVPVEALIDGLRCLQERSFDLILSDLNLQDGQGVETLRVLKQNAPNTSVIALCRSSDRDFGITAVRKGAYDFVCYDDFDVASLRKSIRGAINQSMAEVDKKSAAERRNKARFPCRLAISYQTLERPIISGEGSSETRDISSKGLLFTSSESFQAGQLLQVSLNWPARLENQIPLKLVAEGRIVRNSNGETAMTIEKYEFRTRRAKAKPPTPPGVNKG